MEPSTLNNKVMGIFEIEDPNFGNLWTNIPLTTFTDMGFIYGDFLNVTIKHGNKEVYKNKVLFHKSFGYAEKGDVIIYNNELMKVAMAISQGNLSKEFGLSFGSDWIVEFERS